MKPIEILPLNEVILPMKAKILQKFDRLKKGESLTISNNHNPYILYYQLLNDRGDTFSWNYLEKGPENWRVRITREV